MEFDMDKESSARQMGLHTTASGLVTKNMATVQKPGQIEQSSLAVLCETGRLDKGS
jgi:hypothetical protein